MTAQRLLSWFDKANRMSTAYLGIVSAGGLVVALIGFGIVYSDTQQRGVSGAKRLLLALGSGIGCVGGFLVPYVFEDRLASTYFELVTRRAIVVSPREWLAVSLATGVLIGAIVVGVYLVGIRYALPAEIADG